MHRPLLALLLLAALIALPLRRGAGNDEPATIRGRVLAPGSTPVAGALVELRTHYGGPPWNWGSVGVRTDAQGCFESSVLPPGSTSVIARAPGWGASAPRLLRLEPAQVVEGLELVLQLGGRLTGDVFGPDGRPDARCAIQLQSTLLDERFGREVVSDDQGFFVVEDLDPGTYRLATLAHGLAAAPPERVRMATVEILAGETTHVLLGAPRSSPVRLHGTLERAGVELTIASLGGSAVGLDSLRAGAVRADGSYELTLSSPGEHLLMVADPRSGEPRAEFLCAIPFTPDHRLDLQLPGGAVRGRVLERSGPGLQGVPVTLHREGRPSVFDALGGRQVLSAAGGDFAFELLPPGRYRLRAGAACEGAWNPSGHAVAVSRGLDLAAGQVLEHLELELVRPGTLAGVVLDERGMPAVGATIFVRDGEGRLLDPLSAQRTDAEGGFAVRHVPPGPVTVSARAAGSCSLESAPVPVLEGETAQVRLALLPGTLLQVAVLEANGDSLRADLRVLDELGREVGELRDLERTRASPAAEVLAAEREFGPLAPGTYRVIATGAGGGRVERWVRLDGAPECRLELRL